MKKKVLFILGTAHCGSTLLSLILNSSPQCFTVGELSNLPTIYSNNQTSSQEHLDFWYLNYDREERHKLALGLSNKRITAAIPLKVEKLVRELVNDPIFRPYSTIASKTCADLLIDSTKTIYWISSMLRLKELKKEFDVYLLHLVRDGRAVLNSYLKKRKRMTVEEFSNLWLQRVSNNEEFYDNFSQGKKIRIAYEELATKPQETTQDICQFLDIKFVPEMICYWHYKHSMISGNRGTKSLVTNYKDSIGERQKERDLSIKLDLSWQTTLTKETIDKFYYVTREFNKLYECNV